MAADEKRAEPAGDDWVAEKYDQRVEEAVRFLSSIAPQGQYRRRLRAWHTYEALRMETGGPPDADVWGDTEL